jgi:alanine racemase
MDQCMIRLNKEVPIGTKVVLIGKDQNDEISAQEIAEYLDTINYEIVCGFTQRLPRVYC